MKFKVMKEDRCDHCGKATITYRRWLHLEMVEFLIRLYNLSEDRSRRYKDLIVPSKDIIRGGAKKSTDATYLVHWGLLIKAGRGRWIITEKGKEFVLGQISVPEWIDLREGRLVGKSRTKVFIDQVRAQR